MTSWWRDETALGVAATCCDVQLQCAGAARLLASVRRLFWGKGHPSCIPGSIGFRYGEGTVDFSFSDWIPCTAQSSHGLWGNLANTHSHESIQSHESVYHFSPQFVIHFVNLCIFFSVKACQSQGLGQDLQATTIENSKLKCSSTFTAMCQNGNKPSLYIVNMLDCNPPLQPIYVCLALYSSSCLGGRLYSMYVCIVKKNSLFFHDFPIYSIWCICH